MEKTYNGAVMALPEKEVDLFERINERTARRRAEQEAAEREMYLYSDEPTEEVRSRPDLRRFGGTVARFLLGCVFLGAMARGWCGTEFGLSGAVACGLWAVARWRR